MTTQVVDRVLAEVESATDEIVAFAADLVRVPTLNPPGEAYRPARTCSVTGCGTADSTCGISSPRTVPSIQPGIRV